MQTTCAVSHYACMNKHSLSGLWGCSIRNLTGQAYSGREEVELSCIHRQGHELDAKTVGVKLPLTPRPVSLLPPPFSILFIIDKAPLTHSPGALLVLVRAFLSAAPHPLTVKAQDLK